jgi:hypothetical protein
MLVRLYEPVGQSATVEATKLLGGRDAENVRIRNAVYKVPTHTTYVIARKARATLAIAQVRERSKAKAFGTTAANELSGRLENLPRVNEVLSVHGRIQRIQVT